MSTLSTEVAQTLQHYFQALEKVDAAYEWMIHGGMVAAGIDVEAEWKKIIDADPDADFESRARQSLFAGGEKAYKEYVVWCNLCKTNTAFNKIATLSCDHLNSGLNLL
jgi:hypothetical protein